MLSLWLHIALAQPIADHPGRWYPLGAPLSPEERGRIEALEALGYAGATEADTPQAGVVHRSEAAQPGVTLITSGHRPEATLVDLDGAVLHRWHAPFVDAFPRSPVASPRSTQAWRRVTLLPDGDLLAVHDGLGLVRLSREGRVRWAVANRAHHQAVVDPSGTIWTLTREAVATPSGPVLEDSLTALRDDGTPLRQISVLGAVRASPWAGLLPDPTAVDGDVMHTNSLHRIEGPSSYHPAFRPGHWLLSSRHMDALLVLDPGTGALVWASQGPWSRQHDAQVGASGRLWLFDNRGAGPYSRALALDPADPTHIVWSYGAQASPPLHSDVLGTVQELPNGNVLIAEGTRGRCLEVSPRGEVVWDYHNPHTVDTPDGTLVAAIFQCERLPVPRWLAEADAGPPSRQ